MKILCTSDWHLDWTTAGMRRLGDLEVAVGEMLDYAAQERVDVFVFLGDLINADSGSRVFGCLAVALRAALWLAYHGIDNHWIAGNHDVIEDGSGCTVLSPLKMLEAINAPGDIVVHEEPGMHTITSPWGIQNGVARLLTLPYVPLARAYNPAGAVTTLASQLPLDVPLIVAGHMTDMPGIIPGSETKDMPRGRGMAFPFDACERLSTKPLMVNGHFHEQQVFRGVHIPGALERLTFGEQHNKPGWLVVEV